MSKYYVLAIFIMEKEGVKLFILERGELIAFDAILDIRASPAVCHILLGISCVLLTSKKICQVKKELISNNLA